MRLNRPLGDQRFLEPYSGMYWQVSGAAYDPFRSRSLWDQVLRINPSHGDDKPHFYDSSEFPKEQLRIVERDIYLPTSKTRWRFQVAQARASLDAQIETLRGTIFKSFAALALGLIAMVALQTLYGLWPLRRLQVAIAEMRAGRARRGEAAAGAGELHLVDPGAQGPGEVALGQVDHAAGEREAARAARGRDAADVPFLRSFGEHQLLSLQVITEELAQQTAEPGTANQPVANAPEANAIANASLKI